MQSRRLELVVLSVLLGLAIGVAGFTFVFARGHSYLSDDPAACANCHVMNQHFDAWTKSSHKAVAVCNDCHTPSGFIAKYATKASNGFWHSFAFTTGDFPDPIRIRQNNRDVAAEACLKCHQTIVAAITAGPHMTGVGSRSQPEKGTFSCVRCHGNVGHWVR